MTHSEPTNTAPTHICQPRFELGQIVSTPGALDACTREHMTRCLQIAGIHRFGRIRVDQFKFPWAILRGSGNYRLLLSRGFIPDLVAQNTNLAEGALRANHKHPDNENPVQNISGLHLPPRFKSITRRRLLSAARQLE